MANTPNLDLVKPAGTDHALVSVINSNSDKIDAGFGTLSEQIGTVSAALNTFKNNVDWVQSGDTWSVYPDWIPFVGIYRSSDNAFYFEVPTFKKIGADKSMTVSEASGTIRKASGTSIIASGDISSATFTAQRTGNINLLRLKIVPSGSVSVSDYEAVTFFGRFTVTFS